MKHDYLIRCERHGDLALVGAADATLALCSQCDATCEIVDCGAHDRANYPIADEEDA